MLKPKIRIGHVGTLHDHSLGKLNCVGKYPDIFEVIGIVEENPERRNVSRNIIIQNWEQFALREDVVLSMGSKVDYNPLPLSYTFAGGTRFQHRCNTAITVVPWEWRRFRSPDTV